ncbi:MAG: Mu transposase C-terminal domain-containing protein [Moorella humiferrea]|nr:Mu transposase C-terminal domain-containing protein [Moorella humiferrea]
MKKDAPLALNKQAYEVPQALIGHSITVRYDPDDPSKAYVKVGEPPSLVTVYPMRPVDNARIIRRLFPGRRIGLCWEAT